MLDIDVMSCVGIGSKGGVGRGNGNQREYTYKGRPHRSEIGVAPILEILTWLLKEF